LKTVVLQGTVGSNPTASAKEIERFLFLHKSGAHTLEVLSQ